MGNSNNRDQWAGRERLTFVERTAWWRAAVNRQDLRDLFGISAAQASADLQAYLDLNPGALAYNLSTKRYEARPEMVCALHEPHLDEAVRMFLGEPVPVQRPAAATSEKVDLFQAPARKADLGVERRIFLAIDRGFHVKIQYWSVNSKRCAPREIAPHALGHDGYRWHARAWCFENQDFRDFVLGRIESAEWPREPFTPPVGDAAWKRMTKVTLRPNNALDEAQRKAIERDYGMTGGKLVMKVREAMLEYTLAHLRVADGIDRPKHLEVVSNII